VDFEMADFGNVRTYLKISFEVLLRTFLHQRDFSKSILKEFGKHSYKSMKVLLSKGLIFISDMYSPILMPCIITRS
jgi:hypothetical protein